MASLLVSTIVVYYQNFALYTIVSALNIAWGVVIYMFHTVGDAEVSFSGGGGG
jgi:hypothetical protein